jgi:hypothetical protein
MLNLKPVIPAFVFGLLLFTPLAHGQGFTLTPTTLSPPAGVDPGGTATATVSVQSTGGFDSPVTLSCAVTSSGFTTDLPVCTPSPMSVTPNAVASLTITTVGDTAPGQYTLTVTGTSGSITETAPAIFLNVVNVQQDYTITVSKAISPGTVTAGSGAQATVTITPTASYEGNVTLSCVSVAPTVIGSPVCSFLPPTVDVTNSAAPTSVLTITTFGPTNGTTVTALSPPRLFYSFWLALPGLALLGAGTSRTGRKKFLGIFLLTLVAGGLLFLPSCSSSNPTNNPQGLITPKDTYTFTLTGVDQNGVTPSNTTTSTDQATVILTVN